MLSVRFAHSLTRFARSGFYTILEIHCNLVVPGDFLILPTVIVSNDNNNNNKILSYIDKYITGAGYMNKCIYLCRFLQFSTFAIIFTNIDS